jgi:lipopolysaccharide transport system ATP-binding protein
MPTAIKFENISKQYRLGLVSTRTLSHDLNRWWQMNIRGKDDPYLKIGETNDRSVRGNSEYIWALRDINLEVEQGEVLGIIGKNGAGKSTLLKILSKVTAPTTGIIKARGRIASLLEVGTGFHPEMTGRENIYMNGAIMGMTKAEIRRKMDEIVDFAGVERYIDTPVKRYSSGMTVRLGFAVAAHLEPEILVVDEVLAVGDAEFQKKAVGKMQDISKGEGRTVLFVSHNMASLLNLCHNGILLENGSITFSGKVDDVVDYYLKEQKNDFDRDFVLINDSYRRFSTIKQLEFISIKRENKYQIAADEPINLSIVFKNNNEIREARLIGMLNYEDESRVGLFLSKEFKVPKGKKEFEIKVNVLNHNLSKGKYFFDFNIGTGDFSTAITDFDVVYKTVSFEVEFDNLNDMNHINNWRSNWGRNCFQNVELVIKNQ